MCLNPKINYQLWFHPYPTEKKALRCVDDNVKKSIESPLTHKNKEAEREEHFVDLINNLIYARSVY